MTLDLSAIEKLSASEPGIRVNWRTRSTADGWRAQCQAGFEGYIAPVWKGDGATEQEALDRAVENAASYWSGWRERGGR